MDCKNTVIMPVYGQSPLLRTAIKSVLKQSVRPHKFLIGLDGPNEFAEKIISSIEDGGIIRIFRFKHEGFLSTLNKLINKVNTPYFSRMDADDYAHPDRLRIQLQFMEKNLNYLFVSCQYGYLSFNNKILSKSRNENKKIDFINIDTYSFIRGLYEFCDPGTTYRTADVKDVGSYDLNVGIEKSLQIKLLNISKGAILQSELMFVSYNLNSLSRSEKWINSSFNNSMYIISLSNQLINKQKDELIEYFQNYEQHRLNYNYLLHKRLYRILYVSRDFCRLYKLLLNQYRLFNNWIALKFLMNLFLRRDKTLYVKNEVHT